MTRLLRIAGALLLAAIGLFLLAWWLALPRQPDAFYSHPVVSDPPGTLLRQEPLAAETPDGTRVFRILYATQRHDGSPAIASAVIVAPPATGEPIPVVAYAHGTTGVARGCAPSLFDDPFPNVPGFPELLARGWAYVATDYPGLGTEGGHAYLVGRDAAPAVLDSIRAARALEGADLLDRAVIWGHSQGGHAALWAGQIAEDYAPDLRIEGVAALAPATDLPRLVAESGASMFGKIVSAYLAQGYATAYPEREPWTAVAPEARVVARDIARRCLESPDALLSVAETFLLPGAGIFEAEGLARLNEILAENVPRGPFPMPVFIGQGANDDLVLPHIQSDFAGRLCATGTRLDFRTYRDADHVSIVAPGSASSNDMITWTQSRFDGVAASGTCN